MIMKQAYRYFRRRVILKFSLRINNKGTSRPHSIAAVCRIAFFYSDKKLKQMIFQPIVFVL
jgi:hypothetical protein